MEPGPPVFGRPSPAAGREPALRERGDASTAGVRAEGGSTERWTIRAASVVGIRHRLAGQASDDSFAWAADDGRLAVAVADGIGSAEGAAGAALRAVTAAVGAALQAGVDAAVAAANRAAAGGGATTLVVATVEAGGEVASGRVGDSSAFVVDADGGWCELFEPPSEERLGADTAALPSPEPRLETAGARLGGGVLVLATDGVADPWRDGPTTVAPALAAAVSGHPSALGLAAVTDFSRQGCQDDRTLLCVWARTPEPPR
jgi:hypothetical protein